jgi:hypothetical protein
MADTPDFDVAAAHKHFSVECFNKAWELMDKVERTDNDNEEMIRLSLASHWHWTQREDCNETNLSIGYWQTSRVYAMLAQGDNARSYAERCLAVSQGEGILPVYLGYAYEALARAESVAGDRGKMEKYLGEARRVAETMPNPEAKQRLLDDLNTIK